MQRVRIDGLQIAPELHAFVAQEAAPGSGIETDAFWQGLARLIPDFAPRGRALLAERARLQAEIDRWHVEPPAPWDAQAYEAFQQTNSNQQPKPKPNTETTERGDDEIARIPGPQLVVPLTNARYALNAANARWGSLYDALYGTDAIPGLADAKPGYD